MLLARERPERGGAILRLLRASIRDFLLLWATHQPPLRLHIMERTESSKNLVDNRNSWCGLAPAREETGAAWALLKGGRIKEFSSIENLKLALKGWSPVSPVLVARPFDKVFRPATGHPELAIFLSKKYNRSLLPSLALFSLAFISILFHAFLFKSYFLFNGAMLFVAMGATVWYDYLLTSRSLAAIDQRSLFFYWIFNATSVGLGLYIWAGIMVLSGITQLGLQHLNGGGDAYFIRFGAVYGNILAGQYWRLIVGPFFHATVAHFLNNFLMLMVIGPISWALFGFRSLLVFVVGNTVGLASSMFSYVFIENYPYEAYTGVSSGIFALFGFLAVSAGLQKNLMPEGGSIHIALLAVTTIWAAHLVAKDAANLAHWSGLLAGILLALLTILNVRHGRGK